MGRGFYWKDHGTENGIDHAVLYGPEEHMVAAVVTMEYQDPYLEENCWQVMSGNYSSMNFEEGNTSLSIEEIKERAVRALISELRQKSIDMYTDMDSAMTLLFGEKRKEK